MIHEQENLALLYEQNGVEVHWIELPTRVGAFGPFNRPSAAVGDLWSVHGGIISASMAHFPTTTAEGPSMPDGLRWSWVSPPCSPSTARESPRWPPVSG
jgi:hypothetical protein